MEALGLHLIQDPSEKGTAYSVGQINVLKGCVIETATHATFDHVYLASNECIPATSRPSPDDEWRPADVLSGLDGAAHVIGHLKEERRANVALNEGDSLELKDATD